VFDQVPVASPPALEDRPRSEGAKAIKRATTIAAALLLDAALLATAAPAGARPAAFRVYVVCPKLPPQPTPQQIRRKMAKALPKHRCAAGTTKAAMFRSNLRDVTYKICIKFPFSRPRRPCATEQAAKGVLYYNVINSNVPGSHRVTWFVRGKRIGRRHFRVLAPR
jgi:hypothetical protein